MVTQPQRFQKQFQISSQDLINALQQVQSGGLLRDAVFFQQILALMTQGKPQGRTVVVSDFAIEALKSLTLTPADRSQLDQFLSQTKVYKIDSITIQKAQQIQSHYPISISDAIDWAIHEQMTHESSAHEQTHELTHELIHSHWILVATDRRSLPNAALISQFLGDTPSNPEMNRSETQTIAPAHGTEIEAWEKLLIARLDAPTFTHNSVDYFSNQNSIWIYQQSCIGLALGIALSEKFRSVSYLEPSTPSPSFDLQELLQDAIGMHPLGMMIRVLNAESTGKFKLEIAGVVVMVQVDADRQSPGRSFALIQDIALLTQQSVQPSTTRSNSLTESTALLDHSSNLFFTNSSSNPFPPSRPDSQDFYASTKLPMVSILSNLERPNDKSNFIIDYRNLMKKTIEPDPLFPGLDNPDRADYSEPATARLNPWAMITDRTSKTGSTNLGGELRPGPAVDISYVIESYWIFTSSGDEQIVTGFGNYFVAAGTGNNEIQSGVGVDLFVLEEGEGITTINCYQGHDRLGLLGTLTYSDLDITVMNTNSVEIRVRSSQDILAIIKGITPEQLTQDNFLSVKYTEDQYLEVPYIEEGSDVIVNNTENLLPSIDASNEVNLSNGQTQPIADWLAFYQPGHSQLEVYSFIWMRQDSVTPVNLQSI